MTDSRVAAQRWITHDGGFTHKLIVNNAHRYSHSITYLGRTQVAFGGGRMRWKVQDHRNVEGPNDIPEFPNLDEAKAWVLAITTLE